MIRMNDALASAWADIRRHHRQVPRAVVVVGRERSCGAINWTEPVIMVGQPTLGPGKPEPVLHALLHQAAHGVVGGTSASSGGLYHDRAFRAAADVLGLEPVSGAREGWHTTTTMPDATRDKYPAALKTLATALDEDVPGVVSRSARNGIVARCACEDGLTIRIRGEHAASQLDARPIRCEICGELFAPVTS
jgi:hypothetical protein